MQLLVLPWLQFGMEDQDVIDVMIEQLGGAAAL
jgi:hypothetical protein